MARTRGLLWPRRARRRAADPHPAVRATSLRHAVTDRCRLCDVTRGAPTCFSTCDRGGSGRRGSAPVPSSRPKPGSVRALEAGGRRRDGGLVTARARPARRSATSVTCRSGRSRWRTSDLVGCDGPPDAPAGCLQGQRACRPHRSSSAAHDHNRPRRSARCSTAARRRARRRRLDAGMPGISDPGSAGARPRRRPASRCR
jgi:hypothetical protein